MSYNKKNNLDFKELSVGDLIIQTVFEPIALKKIIRHGIIVATNKSSCNICWTDNTAYDQNNNNVSILNISLRKMIMDGVLLHYPIDKSQV